MFSGIIAKDIVKDILKEKDQKISSLEKENKELKEKYDELKKRKYLQVSTEKAREQAKRQERERILKDKLNIQLEAVDRLVTLLEANYNSKTGMTTKIYGLR